VKEEEKGKGKVEREEWRGIWPTQKCWRGAPYVTTYIHEELGLYRFTFNQKENTKHFPKLELYSHGSNVSTERLETLF